MSRFVETWVWRDSETSGNDRLVLLCLANEADDDGDNCYPSIRRVAELCRISTNTAIAALRRLEEAGELLVQRPETQGRGRFNRYIVACGRDLDSLRQARQKGEELAPFLGGPLPPSVRNGAKKGAIKVQESRDQIATDPRPISNSLERERSPRKVALLEPFSVTEPMREWAAEHAPSIDLTRETQKFCNHWRSKGEKRVDWVASWRNWMLHAMEYAAQRSAGRPDRPVPEADYQDFLKRQHRGET